MPKKNPDPIEAGQPVMVTQGVPDATVVVLPDNTVGKGGVDYHEGDEVTMAGPEAEALVMLGHVRYAD